MNTREIALMLVLIVSAASACSEGEDQPTSDAGRIADARIMTADASSDAGQPNDDATTPQNDASMIADAESDAGVAPDADPPNFAIDTAPGAEIRGKPAISFDGTDFLLIWRDTLATPYDFRAGRVTPEGVALDPGGRSIGTTMTTGYGSFPGVAFDETNHLVVWPEANGDVLAVRVNQEAVAIDPVPLIVGSGSKIRPVSIAFNGTNYLIAWRSLSDEIRTTRVSTAGVALDSITGTVIGNGFYPWIATDGENFLVTWHAHGMNDLDVLANRVSAAGTPLDGTGFVVSQEPEVQDLTSVAFNGTDYLVVWHDVQGGDTGLNDGTVRGVRVSTSGVVLGAPFVIGDLCRGQWPPAVTSDGTDFIVTWQVDNEHLDRPRLVDNYARRVSASGQTSGETFAVTEAPGHQWGPLVAFGADSILIAWSEGGIQQGTMETGVWARVFR